MYVCMYVEYASMIIDGMVWRDIWTPHHTTIYKTISQKTREANTSLGGGTYNVCIYILIGYILATVVCFTYLAL